MKYNKLFTWIFAVAILFASVSCEKIVPVDEEDPNGFPGSSEELMMNGPEMASVMVSEGELARITGMFTNQFTGSDRQYIAIDNYNVANGDFDNIWTILYVDGVKQCRLIEAQAEASGKKSYLGQAQIVEAYLIGTATALWGDVPYTQAANEADYPNPRFDKQSDVYKSVQKLLDEGIANTGGDLISTPVYKNDDGITWGQLANSLKARFYTHTGEYTLALTSAQSGLTNGDWVANHGTDDDFAAFKDGQFNLMFAFMVWHREGYMTANGSYLAKILDPSSADYMGNAKSQDTARFNYFYLGAADCWYCDDYDPNYWAGGIYMDNSPYVLMSSAENSLIMAEASNRAGDNTGAVSFLNDARNYWDSKLGADEHQDLVLADFQTGGILNPNDVSENDAVLKEILLEKYKTCYGQLEAFNDVRRTKNLINIPAKKGTQLPQRFLYPQSEINSNTSTPSGLGLFTPTEVNQ